MALKLILGPLAASVVLIGCLFAGLNNAIAITAAIAVLCIFWWASEAVPVPVTSLIPMALFPLTGILTSGQVASAYGSPLILLLLGGFLLSKAMEYSNAHKKLAMVALNFFGYQDQRRLVLAFMAVTALLSMWISNTATVLMLLPIVIVILEKVKNPKLMPPLLLGLAYSASIGGMGTPIGTPPNLVMMDIYQQNNSAGIDFITWMLWCIPLVIILTPIAGAWLTRHLPSKPLGISLDDFDEPWTIASRRVLIVFALTATAWITRTAPFGGWGQWLPNANDASVAFVAVVILFICSDGKGGRLLNWQHANTIPWGILLLFAGGITLAKAFQVSGLSEILGEMLAQGGSFPILLMLLVLTLGVSFLTETTSNTASTGTADADSRGGGYCQ